MIISKNREISMSRITEGLSMRQLANMAGVNVGTISNIESRPKVVTPRVAKGVCDALRVDMHTIFDIQLDEQKGIKN